jgi:hypothetical protein
MQLIFNGECTQETWHTCLHPDCQRHWASKEANGFGDKSFLGQRTAPGIDPDTLQQLHQNH